MGGDAGGDERREQITAAPGGPLTSEGTPDGSPEATPAPARTRPRDLPYWPPPNSLQGSPRLGTPLGAPRGRPGSKHARKHSLSAMLHVESPLLDDVEDALLALKWEVGEVAREVSLLARLTARLVSMLGLAWLWIAQLARLLAFATCLLPGFGSVGWEYLTSGSVRRRIRYGPRARNICDVFFPTDMDADAISNGLATDAQNPQKRPIAVFFTGGAWIIGYRAWGAYLGLSLAKRGIITVVADYRNYPQGRCNEMLQDVVEALHWVGQEAENMGGDKDRIHVVGQSAGAHLTACTLLDAVAKALPDGLGRGLALDPLYGLRTKRGAKGESAVADSFSDISSTSGTEGLGISDASEMSDSTDVEGNIKSNLSRSRYPDFPIPASYVGVSGPYNLPLHGLKFLEKGLDRRMVLDIFDKDLKGYSPFHRAVRLSKLLTNRCPGTPLASLSPTLAHWSSTHILLIHGTRDASVPHSSSIQFSAALKTLFANVVTHLLHDKTHTDPIIEDPFAGYDELGGEVAKWIWGVEGKRGHGLGANVAGIKMAMLAEEKQVRRRVPEVLVKLARRWNPF